MMNEDVALMSNTVKKEKEIEYSTTVLQTRDWKQCIAIAIHCQ